MKYINYISKGILSRRIFLRKYCCKEVMKSIFGLYYTLYTILLPKTVQKICCRDNISDNQ